MSIKWLQTARHGGLVNRCHTVPSLQSYNVAEHSFNAILIAHTICKDLGWKIKVSYETSMRYIDIDENRITRYLLLHDLPEGYTGDIPANVKKETDLKRLMDKIEDDWTDKNVPNYMKQDLSSQEYAVAKLADVLELCMFCKDEIQMGNRHPSMLHMADRASAYALEHSRILGKEVLPITHSIVTDLRGML